MFGEFPLGPRWAAELMAEVLPASRVGNITIGHRDQVAAQLVRVVWERSGDLADIILRVKVAYGILDRAFDQDPEQMARVIDETWARLGELQERESSLSHDVHGASKDNLEAKFGSLLELYEFTTEQYYRTLLAPYVAADAMVRTHEPIQRLIDVDGRVPAASGTALESGRGIGAGMLSGGVNRHLRNSAAHHRNSILDDNHIRLWDTDKGQYTWGPVEWTWWELRTSVYVLSNTCSVLLLGLGVFDIANGRTIRERGWGVNDRPRPRRRDIVKSELNGMAAVHGFDVEEVRIADDGALAVTIRVKGDTMPEQDVEIRTSGGGQLFQHVRTVWGPLRKQVYGLIQTTFDVHGGYDLVRVSVLARDGKTSLGAVEMPVGEREALINGKEDVDAIRQRLALDSLADEKVPVIIKG